MSDRQPPSGPPRGPTNQDSGPPARRPTRLRTVRSHRRRHLPLWVEMPLLLLIAFCAAVLLRTFVMQSFDIPSGSMENTLQVGDRVVVNKLVYELRDPLRGEVAVFKGTDRWASEIQIEPDPGLISSMGRILGDLVGIAAPNEKDLIKRIIGVGGDTVECCDEEGRVSVNGVALEESEYLYDDAPLDADPSAHDCRARVFGPVVVPPGQVFVMGDHRGNSQDSRCQGFVPVENFIGRAIYIAWPKSSWTSLPIPEVFATIPDPGEGTASGSIPDIPSGVGVDVILPGIGMHLWWRRARMWTLFGNRSPRSSANRRLAVWQTMSDRHRKRRNRPKHPMK